MARFSDEPRLSLLSSGRFQLAILGVLTAGFLALFAPTLVEEVYPSEMTVIQAPVSGHLSWYTQPGWAWQGFGTVTTYQKRITYDFEQKGTDPKTHQPIGGLSIRFSDGGHATMFGSVQFNLPTDEPSLNALHANYRGNDVVTKNLIETVVNKSVYLTGTLMTSKESYAEKKNDLLHYVADQIQNGVYRTRQKTTWIKDEITGANKEIVLAEIIMDKDGKPERQEDSVLNHYNIKAYNFSITTMPYDEVIEKQIRNQQEITMSVQTSIAEAKRADQRALTVEAEGRANAAKAKWEQETIKAQKVVEAQQQKEVAETNANQRLNVADLDRRAAEQTKLKNILEGEGEAAKKKLILEADGALAQKLEAWTISQKYWADAFSRYQGELVPRVIMGQTSGPSGTALQQFMDLQTMKAAQDLGLNIDMKQASPAPRK